MKKSTRFFIFLLILLSVIVAGYGYINFLTTERLPQLVGERVDVEAVEIDLWGRKVIFKSPSFQKDSISDQPDLKIRATAKSIAIENFSFVDLLLSKEIDVAQLTVDSTNIHLILPDSLGTGGKREINLFVREIFNRIRVEEFNFDCANLDIVKGTELDTILKVRGFGLMARDIVIDTATVHHVFPLDFGWSHIRAASFEMKAGDMYTLSGERLLIADTSVKVHNVQVASMYDREGFMRRLPHEKVQIGLEIGEIVANDLIWTLEDGLGIRSTRTSIKNASLKVYKDKRPPPQPLRVKPLLASLIRNIPFDIYLDTLTLSKSYIEYEQFPVLFPRSGKVFFDDLYASIYNLTNDSSRLRENPELIADIQCMFMGEGELQTQIKMNLMSDKDAFSVSGRLGELPVTYVNQVMTPLVGVTAEGKVEYMAFDFNGDNYASKGTLTSEYSDLKITIYDDGRDKEWFKSMFGNLILRNNNHEDDKLSYKEGEIYFVRYQNKGFFNLLWNSIRTGIMDIVVPFYKNPDSTRSANDVKYKVED